MTLSELGTLIETIGLPTTFAVIAILIFYRLIDTGIADHNRSGKITEDNNKELVRLRERNTELVNRAFELEKKYTNCKEDLATERGRLLLLEQQKQYAVEEYLDDTKNFDRDLRFALQKVAEQETALKEKDRLLAEKDNLIKLLQSPP
jgi:hypothetical protein